MSRRELRRKYFAAGMMPRANPHTLYAHEQVVEVALGIAHEIYAEIMARDNELYGDWKKQCPDLTAEKCEELFCQLLCPRLLDDARTIMAHMLSDPMLENLHKSLYDALLKDNVLKAGRDAVKRPRRRFHVGKDGTAKQVN